MDVNLFFLGYVNNQKKKKREDMLLFDYHGWNILSIFKLYFHQYINCKFPDRNLSSARLSLGISGPLVIQLTKKVTDKNTYKILKK